MKKGEEATTKLILEIGADISRSGNYPERGSLSSDGKDKGKALTRYRIGEVALTEEQIALLAQYDDFLNRTEKNIRELEEFYQTYGCLPLGEEHARFKGMMDSYKSGVVPLTESQKARLEKIGVFLSNTERMVRAIENYYDTYHRRPPKGAKSPEGYDMDSAIKGYRSGKRKVTFDQKRRLERCGIPVPDSAIKIEPERRIRLTEEKETLGDKIQRLKEEKESLLEQQNTILGVQKK